MMKLLPFWILALQILTSSTGTVSGRLLSADGTPAANVRVALSPANATAQNADQSLFSITKTDNAGRYRMEQVPPGLYYVTAGLVDTPTYLPGVITRDRAVPMRVTAGGTVEAEGFRLATIPGFQIQGRVELENVPMDRVGTPLMVRTGGGDSASIAADGSFAFSGLRPGKYYLYVTPNAFASVTVNLVDKNIDGVRIRVPSSSIYSSVNGTVLVEDQGLLPRLQVILTNTAGATRGLPNGEQRLEGVVGSTFYISQLPPGEYTVSVRNLPQGYTVQSITMGPRDLLSEKLKLNPTDQPQININLGVSDPPPWVRVQGRLVDVEGMRLPSLITLFGETIGRAQAIVAADGTFEFPQILPGAYRATLTPDDRFYRTVTVGKTNPVLEVPLRIPSFKVSATLNGEDELRRQGRLAPDCSLWPNLIRDGLVGERYPTANTIRGPDGTFEFFPVQAGSYKLVLARGCGDVIGVDVGNAVPFVVADKDIIGLVISAR